MAEEGAGAEINRQLILLIYLLMFDTGRAIGKIFHLKKTIMKQD